MSTSTGKGGKMKKVHRTIDLEKVAKENKGVDLRKVGEAMKFLKSYREQIGSGSGHTIEHPLAKQPSVNTYSETHSVCGHRVEKK